MHSRFQPVSSNQEAIFSSDKADLQISYTVELPLLEPSRDWDLKFELKQIWIMEYVVHNVKVGDKSNLVRNREDSRYEYSNNGSSSLLHIPT